MSLGASPFVRQWLQSDGKTVTLHTGKVDIGQRISTALAQVVAEELTLAPEEIRVAPVTTAGSPDEGITSGSNSVEHSGHALRLAAATLRHWLHARVTDAEGCGPWMLENGAFRREGANISHSIAGLMASEDWSNLAVDTGATPMAPADALPAPRMRGLEDMVRGSFTFVHDIDVPDIVHARVVRPPHARATLSSIDTEVLSRVTDEGLQVMQSGDFIAVAGKGEWAVVRAATRLGVVCQWDQNGGLSEEDVFGALTRDNAIRRLPVVDGLPLDNEPVPAQPGNPAYSERFERPYFLHGALAPSAAFAVFRNDVLEITCHSQGIYPLRDSIADSLGLAPENVVITHMPGSGCYGHNGADDAAFEAALVALELAGTPVLLKWSREDEHAWEPFAPAMATELAATPGPDGQVASFSAEVFSDTHRGRPRAGPDRAGPARLLANQWRDCDVPAPKATPNMNRHGGMHRNLDPVYTFPEKRLVKNLVGGLPHRTSAFRCLGATTNIFALESMMDTLAKQASEDPVRYRLNQMQDARGRAVLERLSEQIALRATPPDTGGRGIAYAQYKNAMTRVGICVDIDMADTGEVLLKDVLIVADAGRVLDHNGLIAQLEGGFIQGASIALSEEVTWDRDGILSRDWESYPVLRFDRVPQITVDLVEAQHEPSAGAGEATPGPAIAAIANALYDATGMRMTRLPLTADAILRHAAAL